MSTTRREDPPNALPQAGSRSGSGAGSVMPYIVHEEDENPNGTTQNDGSDAGAGNAGADSAPVTDG